MTKGAFFSQRIVCGFIVCVLFASVQASAVESVSDNDRSKTSEALLQEQKDVSRLVEEDRAMAVWEKEQAARFGSMDKYIQLMAEKSVGAKLPGQVSIGDQESAFRAELKEKEQRLQDEEKKRVQLDREESSELRNRQRLKRLKEQQMKRVSQPQAIQKPAVVQPLAVKQSLAYAPSDTKAPVVEQEGKTTQQFRQGQSDALQEYAVDIKKKLIEQESSKIQNPEFDKPSGVDDMYKQQVSQPAARTKITPVNSGEDAGRQSSPAPKTRQQSSQRSKKISNKLDQMNSWFEENLW